jgi:hypothetical protein
MRSAGCTAAFSPFAEAGEPLAEQPFLRARRHELECPLERPARLVGTAEPRQQLGSCRVQVGGVEVDRPEQLEPSAGSPVSAIATARFSWTTATP